MELLIRSLLVGAGLLGNAIVINALVYRLRRARKMSVLRAFRKAVI